MKVKVRYLFILFFILVIYLYFIGYRFSPKQAADSHAFLEKDSKVISEVDVGWGHVYIYKNSDYYLTVMAIKNGFIWRAPVSIHIKKIDDKNDIIRTIGWMSYTNNEKEKVTILVVENQSEDIVSIEAGKELERYKKGVVKGELVTFIWNEALFQHDINPVALSKDGRELYRFGYPLGINQFREQDLKWHIIK